MQPKLLNVMIENITLGDRVRKDLGDLTELKMSMKKEGLIHPIAIMELQTAGQYELSAGGRRLTSAKELGWEHIPCRIFPYTADMRVRKTIELVENIIRKDLDHIEEAQLIREIHNLQVAIKGEKHGSSEGGHSIRDTAKLIGKSHVYVLQELDLADAADNHPTLTDMKSRAEVISFLAKEKEKVVLEEMVRRVTQDKLKKKDPTSLLLNSYINGDVLRTLESFDDEKFNLIEVDPPYIIELRKVVKTTVAEDELLKAGRLTQLEKAEALMWLQKVLCECYRVGKKHSWIMLWLAIDPWIQVFHSMLQQAGYQGSMVPALWVKNNGNTRTPNIHRSNYYESYLYARKGDAMLAKPGSPNIHRLPVVPSKIHPNEKPIELYMDAFRIYCTPGADILSAFVGSGNPILAASNIDMKCIGIDANKDYYKYFLARVQDGKPGEYKSYKM